MKDINGETIILPLTAPIKVLIYREALKLFKEDNVSRGLCYYIDRALSKLMHIKVGTYKDLYIIFPEFYWYHNGNDEGTYWWPISDNGTKKRIEVLQELISSLKSKI